MAKKETTKWIQSLWEQPFTFFPILDSVDSPTVYIGSPSFKF